MTTLKTITTIELSSACTLSCSYCINRLMRDGGRVPGVMGPKVFEKALGVLIESVKRGTQQEVNLNGNGEPLMDKQIVQRIRAVKDIIGDNRSVQLSTNGTLMTYDLAKRMKDAGLDRCDISTHDSAAARKAVYMVAGAALTGILTVGHINQAHNWAGQLEQENQVQCLLKTPCHPLIEGRGYIQSDGDIVPCCYDYRSLGKYTNVWRPIDEIFSTEIVPFELCDTCHQRIPENLFPRKAVGE